MKNHDFSNHKFRASGLGHLMTNPRSKKAKISKTTEQNLLEIYIGEQFGRYYEIENKYLDKGNYAEEDSLTLVTNQLDRLLVKNKEHLENDWIKGTPDIIEDDNVLDIKTSWNIFTFANADGSNKDYYWQLQGYMWLTGKDKAILAYTLVDTPEHLIYQEVQRKAYKRGIIDTDKEYEKLEEEIRFQMVYKDIPEELRMKLFYFERNDEDIEKLKERIVDCREYLNSLNGL
jgi:hypothetical protein